MHSLDSEFAREQLRLRVNVLNPRRNNPEGEYVLCWLQSTQRFEDNWTLRRATLEADRLALPMLVYQGLDPTYAHASDRFHTFIMEGARELSRRADSLGITYRFSLRRRRDDDRRVVDRLAARAALVVTDLFPTAGIAERNARFAERAPWRVEAVESSAIVPASIFPREEYAARTIRPKLMRELSHFLEPVDDRAARKELRDSVLRSLELDALDFERADIAAEVARCEIDHDVGPVSLHGGLAAARARLTTFVRDGLDHYDERRREPTDDNGSSRLSPWLHHGMISAAEVIRQALAQGPNAGVGAFVDEAVTWRELSLNFCLRNRHFMKLRALPDWVQETMRAHKDDEREAHYTLAQLERAETHEPLWNAAQRELLCTGVIHNMVRQLWGKSVLLWTRRYGDALRALIHLNDKYAVDGRDPNSYSGIQWCFGKFDRPFAERSVWGKIRPMSLARARGKFDVDPYVMRWRQ